MRIQGNQVIGNLQQTSSYLTDTGSTNAYFVSFLPPITGYTVGLGVVFKASSTNTGPSTLEVDSYGPIPIVKNVSDVLGASDILSGQIVYVIYNGTNFQMMNNPGQGTSLRFGVAGEDSAAGQDRTFDTNTHPVIITGIIDNGIDATLKALNTSATYGSPIALTGYANHGTGIFAESDDYIGLGAYLNGFGIAAGYFDAPNGNAGIMAHGGQNSAWLVLDGDASSIVSNVAIVRSTGFTPVNGIGQSIDFWSALDGSGTFSNTINQIISKATNATSALATSELSFTGVNAGALSTIFTLSGNGAARLNKYGIGTFTGTPTYFLLEDSSGNIIEKVITGAEGVVFTQSSTTLGLGRAQTDTGNTQATISVDREVLTNGKNFRFYDDSTTNVTRVAEFNSNGTKYVFGVTRTETASTKTSDKWALASISNQFVQASAILQPNTNLFQSGVLINGNVTSTSTENLFSSNLFKNEFDASGGYSGGTITIGSNGYGVALFETDFEAGFVGTTVGEMFGIGTKLKLTNSTTVTLDSYTHILVHATNSILGSSTVATHTGIKIKQLVNTGSTTTVAIDQIGTGDLVKIAGILRLIPRTATSASAITPSEGMVVFVSNTNGTFTSIGPWCYYNGAWHAL